MKTKIGTEVAHVTRTPLSRSKGQRSTCRGRGHIVAASRTACCLYFYRDVTKIRRQQFISCYDHDTERYCVPFLQLSPLCSWFK